MQRLVGPGEFAWGGEAFSRNVVAVEDLREDLPAVVIAVVVAVLVAVLVGPNTVVE